MSKSNLLREFMSHVCGIKSSLKCAIVEKKVFVRYDKDTDGEDDIDAPVFDIETILLPVEYSGFDMDKFLDSIDFDYNEGDYIFEEKGNTYANATLFFDDDSWSTIYHYEHMGDPGSYFKNYKAPQIPDILKSK